MQLSLQTMKTKDTFHIETIIDAGNAFVLTGPVANIRRSSDRKTVGTLYRGFRNAPGQFPVPTWWFCPDEPATPVERSEVSEADIICKALAWVGKHRASE